MLYHATLDGEKKEIDIEKADGVYRVRIDDVWREVDCEMLADGLYLSMIIDGKSYTVETRRSRQPGVWVTRFGGDYLDVTVRDDLEERAAAKKEEEAAKGPVILRSPMPGVVVKVNVAEGDRVDADTTVAIVEAMKMQNELAAEREGIVTKIHVSPGEALETRAPIATIDPLQEDS